METEQRFRRPEIKKREHLRRESEALYYDAVDMCFATAQLQFLTVRKTDGHQGHLLNHRNNFFTSRKMSCCQFFFLKYLLAATDYCSLRVFQLMSFYFFFICNPFFFFDPPHKICKNSNSFSVPLFLHVINHLDTKCISNFPPRHNFPFWFNIFYFFGGVF